MKQVNVIARHEATLLHLIGFILLLNNKFHLIRLLRASQ